MAASAMAVVMQKACSPGILVTEPTAKASTSVAVVMVTATPACLRVRPIASARGWPTNRPLASRFIQHWTTTNMSSIPIPGNNDSNLQSWASH